MKAAKTVETTAGKTTRKEATQEVTLRQDANSATEKTATYLMELRDIHPILIVKEVHIQEKRTVTVLQKEGVQGTPTVKVLALEEAMVKAEGPTETEDRQDEATETMIRGEDLLTTTREEVSEKEESREEASAEGHRAEEHSATE